MRKDVTVMELEELLRSYKDGKISEQQLLRQLRMDHLETLEHKFRYDLGREARTGFPEAILGLNKGSEDIAAILKSLLREKDKIFVTKFNPGKMAEAKELLKEEGVLGEGVELEYHDNCHLLVAKRKDGKTPDLECSVGIVAGGTSDIPVAEEARVICQQSGVKTFTAYDVGVAGLHRLFSPLKEMIDQDVDVVIVVAGMEGALPSVVKGLIKAPVIGVPTSVGYGYRASESALISMLNSCVPGLVVTNVDNGFGAAAAALVICSRISKYKKKE